MGFLASFFPDAQPLAADELDVVEPEVDNPVFVVCRLESPDELVHAGVRELFVQDVGERDGRLFPGVGEVEFVLRDGAVVVFLRFVECGEYDGSNPLGAECNGVNGRDVVAERLFALAEFDADGSPGPYRIAVGIHGGVTELRRDVCHDVAAFVFEKEPVQRVFRGDEAGRNVLLGVVEVPPAAIVDACGHEPVLVVGVLEVVEQQRTAFFGERTCGGGLACDDLHVGAARVDFLVARDEHEAQRACRQGIERELAVDDAGFVCQSADLDGAGFLVEGAGYGDGLLEAALFEVDVFAFDDDFFLECHVARGGFEDVLAIGDVLERDVSLGIGARSAGRVGVEALALGKADGHLRCRLAFGNNLGRNGVTGIGSAWATARGLRIGTRAEGGTRRKRTCKYRKEPCAPCNF